jgi:acyl-CoA hydrolase
MSGAIHLADLVLPGITNHHGTLFGGAGFSLMNRAAFIAASRHRRVTFRTQSCERLEFHAPADAGRLIEARATPAVAGQHLLRVEVEMMAENLTTGERAIAARGGFILRADPQGEGRADFRMPETQGRGRSTPEPGSLSFWDIVLASQAGATGSLFGGDVIAAMTKAAFIAASRHCRMPVVVASSKQLDFSRPVPVGSLVEIVAKVEKTGNSSMTVNVAFWCETIETGERFRATQGEFIMVAIGPDHRPARIGRPAA